MSGSLLLLGGLTHYLTDNCYDLLILYQLVVILTHLSQVCYLLSKKLLFLGDILLYIVNEDILGLSAILKESVERAIEVIKTADLLHLHFQFRTLLLYYSKISVVSVDRDYSMRLRVSSHLLSCEAYGNENVCSPLFRSTKCTLQFFPISLMMYHASSLGMVT